MESKFLIIAFTNYLNSKLRAEKHPVTCLSVYPGITDTNLWANNGLMQKLPNFLRYFLLKVNMESHATLE